MPTFSEEFSNAMQGLIPRSTIVDPTSLIEFSRHHMELGEQLLITNFKIIDTTVEINLPDATNTNPEDFELALAHTIHGREDGDTEEILKRFRESADWLLARLFGGAGLLYVNAGCVIGLPDGDILPNTSFIAAAPPGIVETSHMRIEEIADDSLLYALALEASLPDLSDLPDQNEFLDRLLRFNYEQGLADYEALLVPLLPANRLGLIAIS